VKAAITGYITAVINNYTRIIENLEERRVDKYSDIVSKTT